MKPLKRYLSLAFFHSFAFNISCDPRTHREEAELGVPIMQSAQRVTTLVAQGWDASTFLAWRLRRSRPLGAGQLQKNFRDKFGTSSQMYTRPGPPQICETQKIRKQERSASALAKLQNDCQHQLGRHVSNPS